jgi:hypothetical protein
LFLAKLLAEVESLHDATDVLADFVHAPVGYREEHLVSTRALIRAVIKRSVRRGTTIALMMAQAAMDVEL